MLRFIRRIKLLYQVYNTISYQRLRYLAPLLKRYGVKKSIYGALSSKDMPADSTSDRPWLDKGNSAFLLPQDTRFSKFNSETQSELLKWSDNGFAILKGLYAADEVDEINNLLTKLMQEKQLAIRDNRKIMHAVRHSEEIKTMASSDKLTTILELLLGTRVELFQSVNFVRGSEDPAHSDFFHMSTYPYGYLLAVWIALEDIDSSNGPIFYYPGSHKLPYVMNKDFHHGGNRWLLGKDIKKHYAKAIEEVIKKHRLGKRIFTASKGDVIIWQANLLHGGEIVRDPSRTRKSMVLHYFGTNVIRYHEITQRPSVRP